MSVSLSKSAGSWRIGINNIDMFLRTAGYIDQILKGGIRIRFSVHTVTLVSHWPIAATQTRRQRSPPEHGDLHFLQRLDHLDPNRSRIALRISATAAAAIVATILLPILSSNSQPNWQQRLEQMDHAVARAFQGVKNCVVRELEYGSYSSNVDDALRVILVRNCRRQYDAFFQACVATGEEAEICLGFVQSWTAAQFKERFYR
jgi:hypothetical protein